MLESVCDNVQQKIIMNSEDAMRIEYSEKKEEKKINKP
jgi:hypothetical protein